MHENSLWLCVDKNRCVTLFLIFLSVQLQGLDGEATEPMIKELEEDREESQDPEVEFAIAGAVREYGGLKILLGMLQVRELNN